MKKEFVQDLLDHVWQLQKNTWGEGYTSGIHNNWIRAARNCGQKIEIERKNGHPYIHFFRPDGSFRGTLDPWVLPTTTRSSSQACASKVKTRYFLERANVPTPETQDYREGEAQKAYEDFFQSATSRQAVVKAHNLSQGIGVYLNVTPSNFVETFDSCIELQKERKRSPKVLVQEMLDGFELRCTVVEGELVDVIARIPAYVIGTGRHSIEELAALKNESRLADRFLARRKLNLEEYNTKAKMLAEGISPTFAPEEGELIILSSISNIAYGGETAIVTDLVSDSIRSIAERAVAAIPGLTTGGVDVMVNSLDSDSPKVIEVNSFPHAYISIYPTYGNPTNPLDLYLQRWFLVDDFERGDRNEFTLEEKEFLEKYYAFIKQKLGLVGGLFVK
ncbi:ATP-grasp domain-containing protein [Corynebacterium incognita]|uniref:ATP-grasp domain-containing protein n=1 Tax=Corynebacterium incognita TaxID=2754725 RepID=A0A7G7CQT3_9CORY|nr:ATP-grasp domain-containing protein [Corynebacterium incognita]QNE89949.1 ATP-grasp domain-containing protein [Corynebacterium incognita]